MAVEAPKPTTESRQPKFRVTKVSDARSIISGLALRNIQYGEEWGLYIDQYNCEPPRDLCDLKGEEWRANANWGEFRAQIDQDVDPLVRMIMSTRVPATFSTDHGERYEQERWMAIWQAEYRQMLHSWDGYRNESALYLKTRALFGHGPIYWDTPGSWQFTSRPITSVYVPHRSGCVPDEWDMFFLRDEIPIHRLIGILTSLESNEERHGIDGWDAAAIRQVITEYARNNRQEAGHDQGLHISDAEIEELWQDSFSGAKLGGEKIDVYIGFIKEYNGKWSQMIFTREEIESEESERKTHTRASKKELKSGFIFKKEDAYERASDALHCNSYEHHRYYAEVKGLGARISLASKARDTFINSLIDSILIASGLVVQGENQEDDDALDKVEFEWGMTRLPASLEVVTSQLTNYSGLGELMQLIGGITDRNTIHSPNQGFVKAPSRTLGEFRSAQAEKVELSQTQLVYFEYNERDKHRTIMRHIVATLKKHGKSITSMSDDSAEKIERVSPGFLLLRKAVKNSVDQGVPFEALEEIDPDETMVNLPPSPQALMAVKDMIPGLGAASQRIYTESLMRQIVGDKFAGELIPSSQPSALDEDQRHAAQLEHGTLVDGILVNPRSRDDHLIHLQEHARHIKPIIDRYINRQDEFVEGAPLAPKKARLLELAAHYSHSASERDGHLRYLQDKGNSEEAAEQLRFWKEIFNFLQKLGNEVSEQDAADTQAAVDAAQGPDPVKMAKLQTEQMRQEVIRSKASTEIQIAMEKATVDGQIKLQDHAITQRLREEQMRHAQSVKAAEARNKILLEQATTAASAAGTTPIGPPNG